MRTWLVPFMVHPETGAPVFVLLGHPRRTRHGHPYVALDMWDCSMGGPPPYRLHALRTLLSNGDNAFVVRMNWDPAAEAQLPLLGAACNQGWRIVATGPAVGESPAKPHMAHCQVMVGLGTATYPGWRTYSKTTQLATAVQLLTAPVESAAGRPFLPAHTLVTISPLLRRVVRAMEALLPRPDE